jgi:hypothetical protein
MIARFWSAHTTPALAPTYASHLSNQVLPTLRTLDGYVSATLLEREISDGVEIVVITWRRLLESRRGFAEVDLEQTIVAKEAAALLAEFDRRVRHDEVALKDDG